MWKLIVIYHTNISFTDFPTKEDAEFVLEGLRRRVESKINFSGFIYKTTTAI